jgi:hypothetical protein
MVGKYPERNLNEIVRSAQLTMSRKRIFDHSSTRMRMSAQQFLDRFRVLLLGEQEDTTCDANVSRSSQATGERTLE